MDAHSLKKLEYHKIKEMLEKLCQTPLGKPHVLEMEPSGVPEEIRLLQAETGEAFDALRLQPDLRMDGIADLSRYLRRAVIGGVLAPTDLQEIRNTLGAAGRLKFGLSQVNKGIPYLQARAEALNSCQSLQEKIDQCVTPEGEIDNRASLAIGRLRQQIRSLEANARTQLDEILTKSDWVKYLQDPIYTMRGDRYVVPVKAEHRHHFPGIVHDRSSSGATVFMEPMPLVRLMNDLASARLAERQEEQRILEELTRFVAGDHEEIRVDLSLLGELDFIFAKGYLSSQMKGYEPQFRSGGDLEIHRGRHPLIKGDVVPLDVRLGGEFDCLIITGPNTGGKTVALKTVGLLVLMAQSGLHIPAAEGTVLPFFRDVFADIGDEQSIEQSLSTFSGHMTNIVRILQGAGPHSLVILDELGAGTDPEEGSALGIAVLERLMNIGALTIATTHYSELKVFAHSHPRAENANVEFDRQSLRPTFRLSIGVPGESNAFAIAARLGLKEDLIDRARLLLRPEHRELSDLIQNLKEDREMASSARSEAERLQAEVESLKSQLQSEEERIAVRGKEVMARATVEARELVRTARQEAESMVRALRQEERGQDLKTRINKAQEARSKLKVIADRIEDKAEAAALPAASGVGLKKVKPGDRVTIPCYNQDGYVLQEPNASGDVLVQVGILKISVPLDELRPCMHEPQPQTSYTRASTIESDASMPAELNFRGLSGDDAIEAVDKYLDAAYLAGLTKVSLIHGKGTGVLRDVVRKYLAKHPLVASFRSGNYNEGGTGITVVVFKS
jgi:DNA mismatch repair protein MutS2